MTLHRLVERCWRFGGTWCHNLQDRSTLQPETCSPRKLYARLQSVTYKQRQHSDREIGFAATAAVTMSTALLREVKALARSPTFRASADPLLPWKWTLLPCKCRNMANTAIDIALLRMLSTCAQQKTVIVRYCIVGATYRRWLLTSFPSFVVSFSWKLSSP
jgi:hypothetical protein